MNDDLLPSVLADINKLEGRAIRDITEYQRQGYATEWLNAYLRGIRDAQQIILAHCFSMAARRQFEEEEDGAV